MDFTEESSVTILLGVHECGRFLVSATKAGPLLTVKVSRPKHLALCGLGAVKDRCQEGGKANDREQKEDVYTKQTQWAGLQLA
ncbi:hypothetical protein OUZ56_004636 [Daphnia magna]|uniref:Uncharacterized protein n=1 Tax=Daphnia magna TaxID=35525 RepID=A0ABQ9YQE2_9CRUS|nr:hypothetical protein OUZ56_004636 [Daphnia magna]